MAEHTSDYHHGEMDIHEQAATFSAVMTATKWASLYLVSGILAAVLWFCTDTGFLGGLVSALVVVVLGTLLLRKGGGH